MTTASPKEQYAHRDPARVWQRNLRLRRLGFKDYGDYLASPAWSAVKARYRASDLPQDCGLCGSEDDLQFHHMTYERVGDEELADLTPLCQPCHAIVHTLERRGEMGLDFAGLVNEQRARRYGEEDQVRRERITADLNPSHNEVLADRQSRAIRSAFTEAYREAVRRRADVVPGFLLIQRGIELLKEA